MARVDGCRGDEGGLRGVPARPGQRPEPREPPAAAAGAETAEGTQGSAAGSRLALVISHSFYLLLKTYLSSTAVCGDREREGERGRRREGRKGGGQGVRVQIKSGREVSREKRGKCVISQIFNSLSNRSNVCKMTGDV